MCVAECPAENSAAHPFGFNGLQSESLSFNQPQILHVLISREMAMKLLQIKELNHSLRIEERPLAGTPYSFTLLVFIQHLSAKGPPWTL